MAEGEIITIPFANATLDKIAPVTPEQSAPIIPLTPSEVIKRSATAVAAPASIQVESPRTEVKVDPPRSAPLAFTSAMAISAAAPICGVSDSIGPVNPKITPILMSSADTAPADNATAVVASSSFLITFSRFVIFTEPNVEGLAEKRKRFLLYFMHSTAAITARVLRVAASVGQTGRLRAAFSIRGGIIMSPIAFRKM